MYVNVIILAHPRNTTRFLTPLPIYQWDDQSCKISGFSFAYMVDFKYLANDDEPYELRNTFVGSCQTVPCKAIINIYQRNFPFDIIMPFRKNSFFYTAVDHLSV